MIPTAFDAREELRQQIELWKTGRLGSDQHPDRVAWVIHCFEMALTALEESPEP